ncbi:MAG TPA: PAS domain S-box protein [Myxococcaceae bacterium]|nr:PAS domain S-box protein [Myxococcaceae bacterium]
MGTETVELHAFQTAAEAPRHLVQFYETDAFLARSVADYLATGLRAGEGAFAVATGPHREAILESLAARRIDVERALRAGRLGLLDAEEALQELLVDGMPDRARFRRLVAGGLREVTGGQQRGVRAFGEMVDLLWQGGQRAAALRLEALWDEVMGEEGASLTLLCAYRMAGFSGADGLPDVCARHGRILLPERAGLSLEENVSEHVRELATEIAQRREVEDELRRSIADLRKAEEAARRSEDELRDFAEHATVGLQWVDAGGTVLWANRAQLEMLGYQRDEYVGRRLARFHADESAGRDLVHRMTDEDGLRDVEVRLRAGDGTYRDLLISANAFRRGGRVVYYRCFSRDVTDHRRLDAERARLVAELQRTVHLNALFTAILGHDLRNPLNAIMTSMDLLLRRTSEEPLRKPLQRALGSGKRMATMIDQLLDLTRAREGGLPLERQPLELKALADEVRVEIESARPGRAVEVRAEGDLRGRWDRARLSQALSNLVGNAVQHGQEGAPVTVALDGTNELAVRVEIHNRGAIPPDLLPHLFEPFRGLELKRERGGGLGLGLYITEQVVRAHRGDISVTSSEAAGTRFTLSLPRGGDGGAAFGAERAAPEPATAPAQAPLEAPPGVQLLIDSIRDYAIFMLDTQGRVRSWGAGARNVLGYAAEEITGKHFTAFYRPEDARGGRWERELELAQVQGHFEEEGWRVRKDGSHFWASVTLTPVRDEAGALVGFAKVTRDLTERKLTQEALRQEQERFKLLVASVKDYAIFMLDPAGRVATWNAGAERIKGWRAEEIIGRHFSRFYPPADVLAGKPAMELEGAGREGRFEDEGWRLRKDGSRFWANVVITALRDPSGRLTGFGKVTRDLTERHRLEEERLRLARAEGQRGATASAVGVPSNTVTRRR